MAVLDLGRHRPVHGVRRRRADAAGVPGRAAGALPGRVGRGLGPDGPAADRRGRGARDHQADAVDAAVLLGRRRRVALPRELLLDVPGGLAPRRLDRDHLARDRGHLRPLGLDDQPRRRADGDLARSTGRCWRSTRWSMRWSSTCRGPARTDGCRCSSCCARARRSTTRWWREIRRRIREDCSPRHVPDEIIAIAEVPRTLSGKVLEVPGEADPDGDAARAGRLPRVARESGGARLFRRARGGKAGRAGLLMSVMKIWPLLGQKRSRSVWDATRQAIAALAAQQHGYVTRRQLLEHRAWLATRSRYRVRVRPPDPRLHRRLRRRPPPDAPAGPGVRRRCSRAARAPSSATARRRRSGASTSAGTRRSRSRRRRPAPTRHPRPPRDADPRDITTQLGLRVTSPARTLLDIAPRLTDKR